MAVTFFAMNIYGLSLPSFFGNLPVFKSIPTLTALFFVGLFLCYLCIIWFYAYRCYALLNDPSISRREYIRSNLSFSVPVILPWFLLSGVSDIIYLLPFRFPKEALDTPIGQTIYFLLFLTIAALAAPLIIQKFWGCVPLPPGDHRTLIENICQKADIEVADILRWPLFGGRMITAGVMGLVAKVRYILVTPALLQFLSPQELEAVMAHEIGHVKKKHLLFYLVFFAGYLLISIVGFDLLIYIAALINIFTPVSLHQESVYSIFFSIFLILIFIAYFRFLFGFFMRNFERQADIHVYELLGDARPLISSFHKIALISGQAPDKPNWHHFSIAERIDYLMRCENDRKWIAIHHRKVTRSILFFFLGMALVGAAAYDLNFGQTGKRLGRHIDEIFIMQNCEQVIDAYEKMLNETPNSPEILNNLAWIFATSDKPGCQNRKRALVLAEKAIALQQEAHILDTLAEAYYVNGLFPEAIAAEKQALALAEETDRYLYEKQLVKFKKAFSQSSD